MGEIGTEILSAGQNVGKDWRDSPTVGKPQVQQKEITIKNSLPEDLQKTILLSKTRYW